MRSKNQSSSSELLEDDAWEGSCNGDEYDDPVLMDSAERRGGIDARRYYDIPKTIEI